MGTQFKAFRLSERLSPTRRAHLLTTVKVVVLLAFSGRRCALAGSADNHASVIIGTAELLETTPAKHCCQCKMSTAHFLGCLLKPVTDSF